MAQEGALEQIPIGATQEQVLIVLGTPSTVATVSGEAFYYISQTSQRAFAFMPYDVKDQRVIAVYFDQDRRVKRLANYGLKDGKIFDFVSQTTPTGGKDVEYLRNVFKSLVPTSDGARRPAAAQCHANCKKGPQPAGPLAFFRICAVFSAPAPPSSSSATILVILIIGLTAGPAVSL